MTCTEIASGYDTARLSHVHAARMAARDEAARANLERMAGQPGRGPAWLAEILDILGLALARELAEAAPVAAVEPAPRKPLRIRHGTTAGANAHRRAGERPCDACRAAASEYNRIRRQRIASEMSR